MSGRFADLLSKAAFKGGRWLLDMADSMKLNGTDSGQSLTNAVLELTGHCPICNSEVIFSSKYLWLRDHFLCSHCGSVPRERALMTVVDQFFPSWKNAVIHESSPGGRGASMRFQKDCPRYIPSQYFGDCSSGSIIGGVRSENLESLSFAGESIDLHITQDVLEHVLFPDKVFSEIARTLKSGGMHIFTVPLVNKFNLSRPRFQCNDGVIQYLEPKQYHGNPIGDGRSVVTYDWGYDICRYIFNASGLYTYIIQIDDMSKGIRAEYIEVLVTVKP